MKYEYIRKQYAYNYIKKYRGFQIQKASYNLDKAHKIENRV